MKGEYTIRIRNKRVSYTIDVDHNITVICGDSATGKTTLIQAIEQYEELGEKSGVSIESNKPCCVLGGKNWRSDLESITDSFVFVDEGNSFLSSHDFANAISGTDNYYILITRENLHQLPYSVDAILELKKTTSRFRHTYNRTYPRYDRIEKLENRFSNTDCFLTEDSNAGNDFFTHVGDMYGISTISAGGKARIIDTLQLYPEASVIVVADGAAFGSNMSDVYQYSQIHTDKVILYLPESFEWMILRSGIINDSSISEVLNAPSSYIDGKDYLSWERFFYDFLREKTKGTIAEYSKSKLSDYYLKDANVQKMIDVIRQE